MKKLLVLAVMLGLALSANATLNGQLTQLGDIISLNITGSVSDPYYGIGVKGPGVLSDFAAPGFVAPADVAGAMANLLSEFEEGGVVPMGSLGQGENWVFTDTSVANGYLYPDGVWLTAKLTLPVGYVVESDLQKATIIVTGYHYDGGETFTALSSIGYSIPEPITVALLGLGGLFIRRKVA